MKRNLLAIGILAFSHLSIPAISAEEEKEKQEKASSYSSVTSPGGFIAHSLRFATGDSDPEGRVFIEKNGRVIATIEGVLAVSFSPKTDVLLVTEHVPDDDNRHYLLDIGAGEYKKSKPRPEYVIGTRWANRAEWSADGKYLVLFDFPGVSPMPPTVITVADFVDDGVE